MKAVTSVGAWVSAASKRLNARKAAGQTFTGLYTANTTADKKVYEDIYQSFGKSDFDNAVKYLVNAPKYGFELPPTPAGSKFADAYNAAVQRRAHGPAEHQGRARTGAEGSTGRDQREQVRTREQRHCSEHDSAGPLAGPALVVRVPRPRDLGRLPLHLPVDLRLPRR